MKFFFELSYDGTKYHGWQLQNNATSIQHVVNDAIGKITGKPADTLGSGRTDTGVHAIQQYFHWETEQDIDVYRIKYQLNAILPPEISIQSIRKVKDDAHARYDALSRSYIYKIGRHKDPFQFNRVYFYYKDLDLEKMRKTTELFLGMQNFQSFSKVRTQVNNFICNVFSADWFEKEDTLVFYIKANRFLRGMVRSIVGTLLLVGEQKLDEDGLKKILNSHDRRKAGQALPACGLYLYRVEYPEEIFID